MHSVIILKNSLHVVRIPISYTIYNLSAQLVNNYIINFIMCEFISDSHLVQSSRDIFLILCPQN